MKKFKSTKFLALICIIFISSQILVYADVASQNPEKPADKKSEFSSNPNLFSELKISLYSDFHFPISSYNVSGLDLGILHTKTERVYGIEVAGLGAKTDKLYGIQIVGLGAKNNLVYGIEISGLGSQTEKFTGLQIAGIGCNTTQILGIGIAPIFNYKKLTGICIEAFGDISYADNCYGLQISGINSKIKDLQGAQISLCNMSVSMKGFQIGLVNISEKVRGFQIGLYNSCNDLKGIQIGLINHSEKPGVFDVDTVPIVNVGI